MKGNLYQVRTNSYKHFYVIASDYNDAVSKAEGFMRVEKEVKGIFDSDGSLNLSDKENKDEIKSVEILTNEIIY